MSKVRTSALPRLYCWWLYFLSLWVPTLALHHHTTIHHHNNSTTTTTTMTTMFTFRAISPYSTPTTTTTSQAREPCPLTTTTPGCHPSGSGCSNLPEDHRPPHIMAVATIQFTRDPSGTGGPTCSTHAIKSLTARGRPSIPWNPRLLLLHTRPTPASTIRANTPCQHQALSTSALITVSGRDFIPRTS